MSSPPPDSNIIELSKPFLTSREFALLVRQNIGSGDHIRNYMIKKRESFQFLLKVIKRLELPLKVLQNCSYLYQRFYLLTENFARYIGYSHEVALTALFISLKMNDCIKKVSLVLQEGNFIRGLHLSGQELDEQKKAIMEIERSMMECESFDFRNYCIEDLLIKFTKLYKVPTKESYICWAVLNDLYFTELPLRLAAHYNAVVALRAALLIFNGVCKTKTNYNIDTRRVGLLPDDEWVVDGINTLLEYYADNKGSTFLYNALRELDIGDPRELNKDILNVKIELTKKFEIQPLQQYIPKEDLFFARRDPSIAKTGCLRFLYNKAHYLNEVNR